MSAVGDCLGRVSTSVFVGTPDRISRSDVSVMQQSTIDDLPHIQALWPTFEELVGLRGRKMYALIDTAQKTYTVCTPIREGDDPEHFGLAAGVLAGGSYLRGRIVGEPPGVYESIGPGLAELQAIGPVDPGRPLVEFYRRRDQIELWLPLPG